MEVARMWMIIAMNRRRKRRSRRLLVGRRKEKNDKIGMLWLDVDFSPYPRLYQRERASERNSLQQ